VARPPSVKRRRSIRLRQLGCNAASEMQIDAAPPQELRLAPKTKLLRQGAGVTVGTLYVEPEPCRSPCNDPVISCSGVTLKRKH
jgi:hypothetical protein